LARPGRSWSTLNLVLDFIGTHARQLELARYGVDDTPSFVLLTPRSENSKYVVFMILGRESSRPALVAKVARLPAGDRMLEREAANLQAVQQVRPEGYDTVPRVLAFTEHRLHRILLQTALAGRGVDSVEVRRHRSRTTTSVLRWLRDLPVTAGPV
jgi:aminoglycoside phosphotransferase